MKTPILFLVFNRPEKTAQVFEAIRNAKPERLYIAADGARANKAGEVVLCDETRSFVTQIDWPCQVKVKFRDQNLGCGKAVSSAISWFFDNEEAGIILEDDCLPHSDFFRFCSVLLEKYKDDDRVATIGGCDFFPDSFERKAPYFASKYFQMWGWASWRRVWSTYDFSLDSIDKNAWDLILKSVHETDFEYRYWNHILGLMLNGGIDTWDFQMFFHAWKSKSIHLSPTKNLVTNIGYDNQATHTNFQSPMGNRITWPVNGDLTKHYDIATCAETDSIIFFLRFLESMKNTWLVEQVLPSNGNLAVAHNEIAVMKSLVKRLQANIQVKNNILKAAFGNSL